MVLTEEQKKEILEKSGFKCKKCNYHSPSGNGLEINRDFNEVLCSVCNSFAPAEKEKFDFYVSDKIDSHVLETFRRTGVNKAGFESNKMAMIEKAKQGKVMSRPAFGYNLTNGQLVPNKDAQNVKLIFDEFGNGKSLNQIAQQYGVSVNGIKKILKNFTYIGKVKFNSQISQGSHQPLISAEIFNRVQQKFESKMPKD
jgi:hypothetical protein